MQENSGFNFQEKETIINNVDFKKQRQAYLAERNARKKQVQQQVKKEFGGSSSSDDQTPPMRKQPILIKVSENTMIPKQDEQAGFVQVDNNFKKQREKYIQERMQRRQQALQNKRKEFGSSSSSQDQSVPVYPKRQLVAENKIEISPFKQAESSTFAFSEAESTPSKGQKDQFNLMNSVRLKDKQSQKKQNRQKFQVQIPSRKRANLWIQVFLDFKENSIQLGQRIIPLYDVSKMKMIFQPTPSGNYRIKLTLKEEEEVYIGVNPKKMNDLFFLDQYYFIFAKILSLKLQIMGKKMNNISRMKSGIGENLLKEAKLSGKVRKSSLFGSWQDKLAVVAGNGLSLYKQGKEKPFLTVTPGSVKQIWSRFQFQRDNVIVKFLNGSSKIELSFQIQNFLSRENWLYQIYSLAQK